MVSEGTDPTAPRRAAACTSRGTLPPTPPRPSPPSPGSPVRSRRCCCRRRRRRPWGGGAGGRAAARGCWCWPPR
eukprot:108788-Prorocentrum_minimum.AAC.1